MTNSKPTSKDLIPPPFDWIEIPGKGYSIAKYPVTNAQFAKFIDAGGYKTAKWWTQDGWAARNEKWQGGKAWTKPHQWRGKKSKEDSQPVVGVSWYEAIAFCLWLSEESGEKILLPTEEQWQYAAQGDDSRLYPWGNDWNRELCNNNIEKKGTGKTSPVTGYEGKGDSPFAVVDMTGNVNEWCLTEYNSGSNELDDAVVKAQTGIDILRVCRGGHWFETRQGALRLDVRGRNAPIIRDYYTGFRICRSNQDF